MQIVLTTGLVLITSVLTPAVATPVGQMQSAPLPTIVQFALARLVGLEMPMKSASNVSKKIKSWKYIFLANILALDECRRDADCPLDKTCHREECVDPCQLTSCGDRAICKAKFHRAHCQCPAGLQGNPLVQCLSVGCQQDEDCSTRERCDYASQECYPLCNPGSCAPGASCRAENHRESCSCNPPLQGDGYAFCERRKLFCTM